MNKDRHQHLHTLNMPWINMNHSKEPNMKKPKKAVLISLQTDIISSEATL